jgi:energy-coupling factor transporter ATP-binding protein EcfA2
MSNIDEEILNINKNICKNIDKFDDSERGLLSQNILSQLRNLVEAVFLKIYSQGQNIEIDYDKITDAINYVKTQGQFRFLYKFHGLIQKSSSHYTKSEENSERLMLKYYEYLLRVKNFLLTRYNIDILGNINEFPLNLDNNLQEYYEKIAQKIDSSNITLEENTFKGRYYIQKIKPFFVNQKIYYEITFNFANDKRSKFDRVIAFTTLEMSENYAVRLSIKKDSINILDKEMPILIVEAWEVSVRPCEINNFAKIFGVFNTISTQSKEYINLMSLLTLDKLNLTEIVELPDNYYLYYQNRILKNAKTTYISDILNRCRELIINNRSGANIVKYLLFHLNNIIIKNQYRNENCGRLSGLNLNYGSIPFDDMPFASSLIAHNPGILDLLDCISTDGRKHEFLGREIKNNTEINGELYTKQEDLINFENLDDLLEIYNNRLYWRHRPSREIKKYNNHYYIYEYEQDAFNILKKLKDLSTSGYAKHSDSFDSWLKTDQHGMDCDEKKNALRQMFENSKVALIYGSAGTGKSTIINHLSNFFNDKTKLYLTQTNPAMENLRRKIKASNTFYRTIDSFNNSTRCNTEFDILIIDECSTVSNRDMIKVLEKAKFNLLVLVGDIHQIEAISFGNWFSLAEKFIKESSKTELTSLYRSDNENLISLWNKVRKLDDDILEVITNSNNNYSKTLDNSIFERSEEDEIILCLNYDGLYGINNINSFLQGSNQNPPVPWGVHTYKINDPIIFNESDRFTPVLYNNLKGKIVDVELFEGRIQFDIEIHHWPS